MTAVQALKARIVKAYKDNNRKELERALIVYTHAHVCMGKEDPIEHSKKFGKEVQKVVNSAICTLNRNLINESGG